jgi:hypothetical protein
MASAVTLNSTALLQRQCACGQHTGGSAQCDGCKEKEQKLQRHSNGRAHSAMVPSIVHQVVQSPGQALDPAMRNFFEPRFAHDFSAVRVHHDAEAASSAHAVNALAYTMGDHIVFAAGHYAPQTFAGKHLLAHELTHTIQQRDQIRLDRTAAETEMGDDDGPLESEAREMAAAIMSEESNEEADTGSLDDTHEMLAFNDAMLGHGRSRKKSKPSPTRSRKKQKPKPTPCTRNIFYEGTCKDLVLHAAGRCCDPENGLLNPDRSKDIDGEPCPSHKFTPMFTCDTNCSNALKKGCSDSDNWLALPGKQFTRSQCNDVWTICANGKQTKGYVREKSVTKDKFEVGKRIVDDLGVPEDTFKGSIFKPGADPKKINQDPCCSKPSSTPEKALKPGRTGITHKTDGAAKDDATEQKKNNP